MGLTGGLKLKKKHETGFTAVFNMLNKPGCTLKLLTYSSLKGFLFVVKVANGEDGGYLDYDGSKFKKNVTSYLLKLAVISSKNDGYLPPFRSKTKCTESQESYYDEAVMQQTIWKRSISTGGRSPLCPPVANFSIFSNDDSIHMLDFLLEKAATNPNPNPDPNLDTDTMDVLDYLQNKCIKKFWGLRIGVIVMPLIANSRTFSAYKDERALIVSDRITRNTPHGIPDVFLDEAYIDATAELLRLFIDIGVIHFDAHSKNVLVHLRADSSPKCVVIDFGRASNILEDFTDEFLRDKEKEKVRAKKVLFYNRFLEGGDKIGFMKDVREYYENVDWVKNMTIFGSDVTSAQSSWVWSYMAEQPDEYLVKVYDKLKDIMTVRADTTAGIQAATIKRLEKEGRFFNVHGNLQDFIVPFPHTTPPVPVPQTKKRKAPMVRGSPPTPKRRRSPRTPKKRNSVSNNTTSKSSSISSSASSTPMGSASTIPSPPAIQCNKSNNYCAIMGGGRQKKKR
jgi:hypothetical protein